MKKEIDLIVSPREASNHEILRKIIAHKIGLKESDSFSFQLIKRSVDARSRNIKINLRLDVFIDEDLQASWLKFTQMIEQRGKLSLLNTLKSSKPELGENFQINFKVYNTVQENDIIFFKIFFFDDTCNS